MILLQGDALQVISGSAVTLDAHVAFEDEDGNHGRQNTNITTATTANILDMPGAPTARKVLEIIVHNKDVSGSAVSIRILNGSTATVMWAGTLDAQQRVTFADGLGFVAASTAKLDLMRYVTADSVHATAATFVAITGLTPFPVIAGRVYSWELHVFHIADATTTGAQFAIGGVTATFVTAGSMSVVVPGVATTTMSSGVATAVDTAFIVQTTSSLAGGYMPTYAAGTISPSTSGDLSFKATSEVTVAAGLTIKKGSWAHVRETDN